MIEVAPFANGPIRGHLHRPSGDIEFGVVLTHGAGGNCESPLLVKTANALAESGACVLRFNLPFREKRRFGPPFPAAAAQDREGLRQAAVELRNLFSGPLVLGGHSYGGRQASILASEDPSISAALLLLSYPLHPPNKPDDLRTAHFGNVSASALFVHGTKDPFGTVDELQRALAGIPGKTLLMPIEGAGHDLRKGQFDLAGLVTAPLKRMVCG